MTRPAVKVRRISTRERRVRNVIWTTPSPFDGNAHWTTRRWFATVNGIRMELEWRRYHPRDSDRGWHLYTATDVEGVGSIFGQHVGATFAEATVEAVRRIGADPYVQCERFKELSGG